MKKESEFAKTLLFLAGNYYVSTVTKEKQGLAGAWDFKVDTSKAVSLVLPLLDINPKYKPIIESALHDLINNTKKRLKIK